MCSSSRCTRSTCSALVLDEVGAGPSAPGRRAHMASCCLRPLPLTEQILPQCRQGAFSLFAASSGRLYSPAYPYALYPPAGCLLRLPSVAEEAPAAGVEDPKGGASRANTTCAIARWAETAAAPETPQPTCRRSSTRRDSAAGCGIAAVSCAGVEGMHSAAATATSSLRR
eukprot:scaffold32295_cov74-Phaeocystis_antarctica.AAC.4